MEALEIWTWKSYFILTWTRAVASVNKNNAKTMNTFCTKTITYKIIERNTAC